MVSKNYNHNLEALRGFAALIVLFYHTIINSTDFSMGFDFRGVIWPYTPSGHLMVLIFFMLSGYVIGVTNKSEADFDWKLYLKKRATRIYPIYFIVVVITFLLFRENILHVLSNCFFMQNVLTPDLFHNKALWSIHHEVVHYLLILPVMLFRIRPIFVISFVLALLTFSLIFYPFPRLIEAYLVGFVFWFTGFVLSKQKVTWQAKPNELLSVLLFLLGCDFLNLLSNVWSRINFLHSEGQWLQALISSEDIGLYIITLYVLLVFSGVNKKLTFSLFCIVYASAFSHLGYLLVSGGFFKTPVFIVPAVFIILSFVVYFWKSLPFNHGILTWFGSISYSVYIIHMPILYFIAQFHFLDNSFSGYLVRLVVLLTVVVGLSYFLEKKLQPGIRKWVFGQ